VWRAAGSPGSWRHLATGWDCDAWIADESLVWRAPRRNVGIAALEREAAVMPILAPRLPAPVPVPVLFEPPDLPALARHVWIPGVEMAEARETDPGLGRALGRFLAALHRPERVEETRGRLPADPLGRADPERRLPVAHRRLDEIAGRTDVEPLRRIVDAAAGPPLSLEVVCHGDLHLRHALIDAAGGLAGVIDWGDCCVGAKGVDLAIATALTFEQRSAFLDAYGSVDESSWRHARMLAVTLGAALLAADPAGIVGAAALRWLGRITEEP
jgi:aminoglycoside phosphotransferase (APT) family kinase protein